ncbi:ribokinase [Chryseolinea sp. T2]|uniref:ribokinase n=1 Tax=Chryseolinea sp. T2 TaxID=3129255 RepID=UPI003078008F
MSKILVIGSSNTDLITKVKRFPLAGETITGQLYTQAMGGKGANQALAARRSGGDVSFVTCLGSDANGRSALQYYAQEGLDISRALQVDHAPTGTAVILVNEEGENIIVLNPGANHQLHPADVSRLSETIRDASIVMLQMEIPLETVIRICELANEHNVPVMLNVAPAREISESLVSRISYIVVNETEIESITKLSLDKHAEDEVIDHLLSMGAKTVILTLGSRGCIVKSSTFRHEIHAFQVETVDTTAAGDTFCGALVAQLSKGETLENAIRFATAAAAICVTRLGAQPSIPFENEVKEFLQAESNGMPALKRKSGSRSIF